MEHLSAPERFLLLLEDLIRFIEALSIEAARPRFLGIPLPFLVRRLPNPANLVTPYLRRLAAIFTDLLANPIAPIQAPLAAVAIAARSPSPRAAKPRRTPAIRPPRPNARIEQPREADLPPPGHRQPGDSPRPTPGPIHAPLWPRSRRHPDHPPWRETPLHHTQKRTTHSFQ